MTILGAIGAGGGVAMLLAGTAYAQSTASPAPAVAAGEQQEIIVTANKRSQRLLDVPASITAETQADLQRRGAEQLEDIVRNTPGLSNPGAGAGNNTNLTIRGVTSGTALGLKQSTVALLFDDIPVDPSPALSGTNLRTVDIERVEVLRGPQGTLFGSGSLSGAVRFITNKPDFTHFSGSAEITGAGTQTGQGSVWGNLELNVPIVTDKLAVRAVGYGYDEGGWVDDIAHGRNDINGNRTAGGRVALAARPADRLSVTVTGIYQDSDDRGFGESTYVQPAGYGDHQVTSQRLFGQSDVKTRIVNAGLQYQLPSVTLFSSSSYYKRNYSTLADLADYVNPLLGLITGAPISNLPALSAASVGQDIFTQELRIASAGARRFRWTLGGFYLISSNHFRQLAQSDSGAAIGIPVLFNLRGDGVQEEVAGFGEATYTLADRIDFTAGVRVQDVTVSFLQNQLGGIFSPPATGTRLKQHETPVTPRFSIAYRPSRDLTVYAQAARGFRVGGPNLTFVPGATFPPSYTSDSLWNYEIGVKSRLFGGKAEFRAAGYYIDWSDIQVALVSGNLGYTGNAGSARVYGFEFEGNVRLADYITLGGSFSANHGELTRDVPTITRVTGVLGAKSGDRLPASPEIQLAGFAELEYKLGGHDAYFRVTDQYIGAQYTDFASKGLRFGDFQQLDLRAGVRLPRYEFVLFLNNATNSDGKRSAGEGLLLGPNTGIPNVAYRQRPRTYGVTVRANF